MPDDSIPQLSHDGSPRRIGYEIEFTGLDLKHAAGILQNLYGGTTRKISRYEYRVEETEFGTFVVELDAGVLKKMVQQDYFADLDVKIGESTFKESIEEIIGSIATAFIPLEISMPPVTVDSLERLETCRTMLRRARAEGTGASWLYAFGFQINAEVPSLQADVLCAYLRAFLLMYDWLVHTLDVDITRRLSPFIDPFPYSYAVLVMDKKYNPDQRNLIDDYLEHNPTRNRPLDMTPVFGCIDKNRVVEVLRGQKIKPRPAFHYRLPNSRIDDEQWSMLSEWSLWLLVERLANSPDQLFRLMQDFNTFKPGALTGSKREWIEHVDRFINETFQADYRCYRT